MVKRADIPATFPPFLSVARSLVAGAVLGDERNQLVLGDSPTSCLVSFFREGEIKMMKDQQGRKRGRKRSSRCSAKERASVGRFGRAFVKAEACRKRRFSSDLRSQLSVDRWVERRETEGMKGSRWRRRSPPVLLPLLFFWTFASSLFVYIFISLLLFCISTRLESFERRTFSFLLPISSQATDSSDSQRLISGSEQREANSARYGPDRDVRLKGSRREREDAKTRDRPTRRIDDSDATLDFSLILQLCFPAPALPCTLRIKP